MSRCPRRGISKPTRPSCAHGTTGAGLTLPSANWVRVVDAYQQAVELDTGFALAFAELAWAHARLYYLWHDHSPGRLESATRAAEKALALSPEMPGVHLALGYYYLYADRDPKRALDQFAIAEKGMPHSVEILEAKTAVASVDGRWEDALESVREAVELSPRDGSLMVDLAEVYWVLRRYEEAVRTCDLAIELAPDDAWPYLMKTFSLWSWRGAYAETRTILQAVPVSHDWAAWVWYWQKMFERDYGAAIEGLSADPNGWIRTKCWAMPKSLLAGYAWRLRGDREKALKAYESAQSLLEAEAKRWPDDPRYHSSLGIAYAALGRKADAVREGRNAVELLPVATDAFYGLPYVMDLAFIYTLNGDTEAAVQQLEYLLSIPSWMSVSWLRMDPEWDLLRDKPAFNRILVRTTEAETGGS